ncbi:MAG: hypothetical protein A2096_06960 [Spirochaetes bacterium GWF1_41_5]|nr:MAG: hypothetical protein A2096_06960 [Spirochaetes bacterium GWF1_41_5]
MINQILNYLNGLPQELVIIILSVLPVSELRGAMPVAYGIFKMTFIKSFILAVVGNSLMVFPFLWFLHFILKYIRKIKFFDNFFTWWFKKVEAKSDSVKKLEFWGLVFFVGIPLPMTGAYSGCVAGYLLNVRFSKNAAACFIGILMAGLIVAATIAGVSQIMAIFK